MGFYRTKPAGLADRAAITASVLRLITARDIAEVAAETSDPFGLAHNCSHPAGHFLIPSAGDIVCAHCEKVFWR